MKKIKYSIFIFLVMILLSSPLLVGCNWTFRSADKLATPEITLDKDNNTLLWHNVKNATAYDIYCNDSVVDTYSAPESDTVIYELIGVLGDSGTYVFEIVATTDSIYISDSDSSNSVTLEYVKKELQIPDTPSEDITTNEIQFSISSEGILNYIPLTDTDYTYFVYLYSNNSPLVSYELTSTTTNLISKNYITSNTDIYAIRMGYQKDGEKVIANGLKFYNPVSRLSTVQDKYKNNIYLFDGYINDFYITSLDELKNIVYYCYINRIEEYDIQISTAFQSAIASYSEGDIVYDMVSAVQYARESFFETISIYPITVSMNGSSTLFTINIPYGDIKQCDTSIPASPYEVKDQAVSDAYYMVHDFESLEEKYGDTYDNFVSDRQFLKTSVATSEQLFWAVENKVTPVITDTSSRAYTIYNKAKSVLRSIISEDMTDYEKALCIFDWICVNTNYDYTSYTQTNGYTERVENHPALLPCFYLEGVFITGNSVCDGFSKAFSLMCNMIGIDAIRVVGEAGSSSNMGGHAWNKVFMNNEVTEDQPRQSYLVDITWTEILSNYGEELSHTYFGLSDEDMAESHKPFASRLSRYYREDEYNHQDTTINLRYYNNTFFEHKDTDYDLVITNNDELSAMFDYMLIDGRGAMEVVFDYDYMVEEYNKNHDIKYRTSTEKEIDYITLSSGEKAKETVYDYATDTFYHYVYYEKMVNFQWIVETTEYVYQNYKLRETFAQKVMKVLKFQEQYLFLSNDSIMQVYDDEGNYGLLYILTQNLLIDADGEINHLIEALDEKDAYGTFNLYIKESILNTGTGSSYLEIIHSLFDAKLAESNINIEFSLKQGKHQIDSSLTAAIYTITVTEK